MPLTLRQLSLIILLVPTVLQAESFDQTLSGQSTSSSTQPTQSLKDIYALALAHDPTWAAARYANTGAQEKLIQGKALLLPTVSLNSTVNHSDTNIQYTGQNVFKNNDQSERFNTLSYGVNINQPLYRKQNSVQYQASQLQVSAADLQLQQEHQDLIMKSAQAYFDVLLAQDKLTLYQAQKAAIESQLAQAHANFRNGVSTITDVDEAQAKFDVVQSQAIAANIELENKKQAVELLTGQFPSHFYGVKSSLPLSLPVPLNQVSSQSQSQTQLTLWLQQAQQNNLTIQLKKLDYELSAKSVELNQAGHLPTLDAVANYTRTNANGGINGYGNDLNNTTVGLQMQIPLYQGGAVSSKVREAVANQQKAQEEVQAATRKVVLETKQAYLEITSNIAQAAANQQTLHSAQSQLASTNKSFKLGIRTNVDVLNAQQQVFNAKRELLQTHYSYLLGLLKLKYHSGLLNEQDLEGVDQLLEHL
ncbi:MAG: type I secretion protein TolC [Methylotenera sp.]|nr:MAG: type I secretion protein TolC [Methylotenera sp.]